MVPNMLVDLSALPTVILRALVTIAHGYLHVIHSHPQHPMHVTWEAFVGACCYVNPVINFMLANIQTRRAEDICTPLAPPPALAWQGVAAFCARATESTVLSSSYRVSFGDPVALKQYARRRTSSTRHLGGKRKRKNTTRTHVDTGDEAKDADDDDIEAWGSDAGDVEEQEGSPEYTDDATYDTSMAEWIANQRHMHQVDEAENLRHHENEQRVIALGRLLADLRTQKTSSIIARVFNRDSAELHAQFKRLMKTGGTRTRYTAADDRLRMQLIAWYLVQAFLATEVQILEWMGEVLDQRWATIDGAEIADTFFAMAQQLQTDMLQQQISVGNPLCLAIHCSKTQKATINTHVLGGLDE